MTARRVLAVSLLLLALTLPSPSEALALTAPQKAIERRVIGLEEAIDLSLGGFDLALAEGNLAAARTQHDISRGAILPSLSASGGLGLLYGLGDASQISKALSGASSGLGSSFSGSLSLSEGAARSGSGSSSGTSISLNVKQGLPPSPQEGSQGRVAVSPSTALSATLSQSLWDGYPGGQAKATVDKSLLTLQGKEIAAKLARAGVLAKVKQTYVAALTAQRTLSLRQGLLDKQKALLAQVEATYALRQASAIELQTARINARSAELDLETSRHDLALALQRLANLIGLPPDSDYEVAEIDTPALPAGSLEEAIAKALAARADIAQLELAKSVSAIDLTLAEGSTDPLVSLSGGVGLAFTWGAAGGSGVKEDRAATGEALSLGLSVGLPLLDSGSGRARIDSARVAGELADTQAALLRLGVAAEVRDAWWTLSILAEKTDLARLSAELAENQLALVREQLRFGTATTQDLLSSSVNAANAEAAWLKTKSDQLLAIITLETAMGR